MNKKTLVFSVVSTAIFGYLMYYYNSQVFIHVQSKSISEVLQTNLISEPNQRRLKSHEKNTFIYVDDYVVEPTYGFELAGTVLSTNEYPSAWQHGDVMPVDFAMGWGPMSKMENINQIEIQQSGRWYRWKVENYFIPRRDIEQNSANMHLVPATPEIKSQLLQIRKHDMIYLRGKLININKGNGKYVINSSTTRKDTGAGACEIIYVEEIKRLSLSGEL